MSRGTVWTIVKKDLRLRRRSAHMVPHLLTDEQKAFRKCICEENLALIRENLEENLARIITTDKTWIATFEPKTKKQSSAWILPNEDPPQKARRQRGQQKTMMTLFLDFQGTVHCEFLQPGDTIRSEDYCETLSRMKESVRWKRPHLWARKEDSCHTFLLHQDNASPHTSVFTLAKLGEWGVDLLAHPPYSPDLAPCDFAMFPKVKEQLRGRRFPNLAALQKETKKILRSLPEDFYTQCFIDLVTRWEKCVARDGDYFEGAHVAVLDEPLASSDSDTD